MTKSGARVGAVASANEKEVRLFGYGVYEGDQVPPPNIIGPFGIKLHDLGHTNPKIVLDNGDVVWGCECWWGLEEVVKNSIGERTVITITPEEYRAKAEA